MRRRWDSRKSMREKCIKKETLCWQCAKACGGCSWSNKAHKPVEGWTAERRDLHIQNSSVPVESYVVYDCPEYASDEREHGLDSRAQGFTHTKQQRAGRKLCGV